MWLKSNAITNVAHDLQSSDPEIARAAPRRFALARRPPPIRSTILPRPGRSQVGKSCKSKRCGQYTVLPGQSSRTCERGGGLPQLLRAVQKTPSRTAGQVSPRSERWRPARKPLCTKGSSQRSSLANDFSLTSGLETVVKDAQGSSRGVWLASRFDKIAPHAASSRAHESGSITRRATPRRRKGMRFRTWGWSWS